MVKRKSSLVRRRLLLFLVVLLALVLLIILRPRQDTSPAEILSGRLMVVDGDSFRRADGSKVRLLGIDTPEKGEPLYQEAKIRLAELLQEAELSYRHGRRRFDRYGRELAFVYAEGLLVNRILLAEGLARAYLFMDDLSDLAFVDSLCAAQQQARALDLGIWSLPEPETCNRYFGKKERRRFHRPDCPSVTRGDTLNSLRLLSRDEFLDRCYSPCRNCKP